MKRSIVALMISFVSAAAVVPLARAEESVVSISFEELPPAVQATVRNNLCTGCTIGLVEREQEKGKPPIYEVHYSVGAGRAFHIRVGEDGTLLFKEIPY
jgi:hypothetical protein